MVNDDKLFDLYTDYLISSFSFTTATAFSDLMNGSISHDRVSRFLNKEDYDSKFLWNHVKPIIRELETEDGVLIFDDFIQEKPYSDENVIIAYHWDHSKQRMIKGVMCVTGIYHNNNMSIPVCFDLVKKTEMIINPETGNTTRQSQDTKNDKLKILIKNCIKNKIVFSYILIDSWYGSKENMNFIKVEMKKDFLVPLKSNRNVALSKKDKLAGKWIKLDSIKLKKNEPINIYVEGVEFPLQLCITIFKNKDSNDGVLYLVTSDLKISGEQMNTIYHKRWKVEEFHKSVKQNASLEKSPTKIVKTQTNHFVLSLCAYVKLEKIKLINKKNHFAMRRDIYISALKVAFEKIIALNHAVA
jgi:hypothetical protein